MQTKKVKALDLLRYTLPLIVRGRQGLYEIVKVVAENSRVKCYRASLNGSDSLVIDRDYNSEIEIVTHNDSDNLLDTIGTLYKRNKSLTKGHATLTRRVQELEAALAEAKQQVPVTWFDVIGDKVHINDAFIEKGAISKAQHDLHQFVTEEVKRQLVAATKSGGILNGR